MTGLWTPEQHDQHCPVRTGGAHCSRDAGCKPASGVLPSDLRTPEQMVWIMDRYRLDGLGRLARANRHYADSHGEYLPDVAALAHAALTELERCVSRTGRAAVEESPFPHPEFAQESERSVPAALQAAVNEIASLRLMSYTGGQPDLREEDVRGIRDLLIDLTLLLAERTGEPLPEPEALL